MTEHLSDCAYCGKPTNETRDHVPAKRLFPSPRPSNLITVPAHHHCNNSFSQDEEYFVAALLTQACLSSDSANRVLEEFFPKFALKRRRESLARLLKKDLHDAELHSNAGIYLGNATVLELDTERVNRILAKIVMGLFYHEYGRICPEPEPWVALLHGPEQIADLPVPVAESPGAVRIGHPERSHLVEYLAPNSVFNSLPRQRSSPHLRPDDRFVTIDRVLHHASLGVA